MKYEHILTILPVIYPRFYSSFDNNGNEFIFLLLEDQKRENFYDVDDKTQLEALMNHFHLFEKVGEKNKNVITCICSTIAKNLLNVLTKNYPEKKFVVYLEVNPKDSVIVRFHQIWENEIPYIDVKCLKNKNNQVFEYKN